MTPSRGERCSSARVEAGLKKKKGAPVSPRRQYGSAASGPWPNAADPPGSWGVAVSSVRSACPLCILHRCYQVCSPDLWMKEAKVITLMWLERLGRVGSSLGNCNSFLPSSEREEKTLSLDDGINTSMGPARTGRLGSLSDAEQTRRERERKSSNEAEVGNVEISTLDLWRDRAAGVEGFGNERQIRPSLVESVVNTNIVHLVSPIKIFLDILLLYMFRNYNNY